VSSSQPGSGPQRLEQFVVVSFNSESELPSCPEALLAAAAQGLPTGAGSGSGERPK